jgi:hypothetical protein
VAVDFGLKGYSQLKNDVNKLFSDQIIAQSPTYNKFIRELTTVENVNNSAKNKYQYLTYAYRDLVDTYNQTNDHALYNLPQEVSNFTKTNFPKLYNQPPEMLKVVAEINASSIPAVVKVTFVNDLTGAGYISKNSPKLRAFAYIIVAGVFNSSGALTKTGLNTKLSQEILDYVQKTYPKEYQEFQIPSVMPTIPIPTKK